MRAGAGLGIGPACAALSAAELAKIAQSPVGAMVGMPLQNNTGFSTGPRSGTQNL
jgi:hypothetical protein